MHYIVIESNGKARITRDLKARHFLSLDTAAREAQRLVDTKQIDGAWVEKIGDSPDWYRREK